MAYGRKVKFSAADGVLRVWNPTPLPYRVVIGAEPGSLEAVVSPGCLKEFALDEGEYFAIALAVDKGVQPPPYPPALNPAGPAWPFPKAQPPAAPIPAPDARLEQALPPLGWFVNALPDGRNEESG